MLLETLACYSAHMERITEFLERYRLRVFGAEEQRRHVREAIAVIAGITVDDSRISFRRGVCTIEVHAAVKNEVFLRKKDILAELVRRGVKIVDIR